MAISIDINCDLGEYDLTLHPDHLKFFDFISSCNIATGFHAGDPVTMQVMIRKAVEREVAVGAHPSYPDKQGFGRRSVEMNPDELFASLSYQISALAGMCLIADTRLHHIKLHGALYHDAHHKEETAGVIIDLVRSLRQPVSLYGLKNSILGEMAVQADIPFYAEGFIDRRYDDEGRLMPRTESGSTLADREEMHHQALDIIQYGRVKTASGEFVPLEADTLCIHSDHADSLDTARSLHKLFAGHNIRIKSPA